MLDFGSRVSRVHPRRILAKSWRLDLTSQCECTRRSLAPPSLLDVPRQRHHDAFGQQGSANDKSLRGRHCTLREAVGGFDRDGLWWTLSDSGLVDSSFCCRLSADRSRQHSL